MIRPFVYRFRRFALHNAVCISCVFLTACTTPGPERIVTKTLTVPVAIKCAAAVAKPDLPATPQAIAAASDIDALARLYRADWLLGRAYIAELEAANSACR